MKPRRIFGPASALCLILASCDKTRQSTAGPSGSDSLAAERAAIEDERMELERQRLDEDRAALEADKEALRAEREARLAAREDEIADQGLSLEERERELLQRETDLNDREGELVQRESHLSDRELELAGTEAFDDWEPEPVANYDEPVADYSTFYDDLQPHGSWFETPDYGYVYQPTVVVQDSSWRPYTRGRWACTNQGWTWVSDEPFGWACFHYGRWTRIAGHGWVWVPGDEWAPSWVCWREGGDHIGWAPLPPETLCYRKRGWNSSVEVDFGIGHGWFSFVHCRHMADPIWRHCLPVERNRQCIQLSVNITNIHVHRDRIVSGGPRYEKLRALVGKPWPVYQLETDRFHGLRTASSRNPRVQGNRLALFAPNLDTRWNDALKPSRVAGKWDDVKVERAESGIKPEWTERFRAAREKRKEQAVASVRGTDAGALKQQLEANRTKVADAQQKFQAKQQELLEAREAKRVKPRDESSRGSLPEAGAKPPGEASDERRPSLAERQRKALERMRDARDQRRDDSQRAQELPRNPREASPGRSARSGREPQEQRRDEAPVEPAGKLKPEQEQVRREPANRGTASDDSSRRDRMAEAQRQRQEQLREQQEALRLRQEEARQARERERDDAGQDTRRERMEQSRREQQEADQQRAEQGRRNDEARQRQQDEARERQDQSRRQAEENQRRQQQEDRARQQEEERARQDQRMREQQERARQQQEETERRREEARREAEERARQQQEERARQQEEMERRREEAGREAEERARQQEEMERRREEARREAEERARQQQEERARQQEERQRQQEERARQQEQEKARQQEERQREREERQRGR